MISNAITTKRILFFLMFAISFVMRLSAQCPMCRSAAEANVKLGGTAARGLNTGILYLFAMPYLVVGLIAFLWWRSVKKKRKEEAKYRTEKKL